MRDSRWNLTQPYLGPPLGVPPVEFRQDLWHRLTRVPGLSYSVVCVILCLTIFVELRLVTDGIHDDSIYRASIASHSDNNTTSIL